MVDGKECVKIIKELKKLPDWKIKKMLIPSKKEIFLDILGDFITIVRDLNFLLKEIDNKEDLLSFILELKEKERLLEKLSKEVLEKEERIKFLEEKQINVDEIVQEKISQTLKEYEEKIKLLEKENKELKEQLGYYG